MPYFLIATIAYLLGSIPSGFLAGRIAGVDVREQGSGNIGATNVLRVLGKKYGYAVFLADGFKGLLAVRLAMWLGTRAGLPGYFPAVIAAIFSVIGHSYPVWLGFRGGKGVATSAGAWFGLIPLAIFPLGFVWLMIFFGLGFVSVASMAAACILPFCIWIFSEHDVLLLCFALLTTSLIILRHRSNIERLFAGTEPRSEGR